MTKKQEEKGLEVTLKKELTPYVAEANIIQITDGDTMKSAVELMSNIGNILDRVTGEKEKITKPANEILKAERARWKPLEAECDEAEAILRRKITDYQTEAKKVADREAERIAARVGDGKGHLQVETAMRQMSEIEKPEAKVETDSGTVKFRTVKKFEVMDIIILANSKNGGMFLQANEPVIRAEMNAGRELPGVRYYEEQVPVSFR